MQQDQLMKKRVKQMNSPLKSRSISEKLKESQSDLPIQDAYDERRKPRSKKYLATVRAIRTQYAILAEKESKLVKLVQGEPEKAKSQMLSTDLNGNLCMLQISAIAIHKEIETVAAEIRALEKKLTQLMPKGDALVALLYMDSSIGTLMSRGIISQVGSAYHSVEELCEYAYTEEEQRALVVGDVKLHSQPTPLVVEVYLHLVVRVNADGRIETFEV